MVTVTNRELLFRSLDEYRNVNQGKLDLDLLLEPFGRNTAVAIAVAALHVREYWGDEAQLLILPADHLILDQDAFAAAVSKARSLAEDGYLATFGIQPDKPETGFGYIEQGPALKEGFRSRALSKNPTWPPPRPMSTAATTCGTPGCSASAPIPCCRN